MIKHTHTSPPPIQSAYSIWHPIGPFKNPSLAQAGEWDAGPAKVQCCHSSLQASAHTLLLGFELTPPSIGAVGNQNHEEGLGPGHRQTMIHYQKRLVYSPSVPLKAISRRPLTRSVPLHPHQLVRMPPRQLPSYREKS